MALDWSRQSAHVSNNKSSQQRPPVSTLMSLVALSGRSARTLAARCLPPGVKGALKTSPLRTVIDSLEHLEARVFSRGLSANRVFELPIEYKIASASMSIVVPIHDAPSVTMRCLASLERDATKSEVILVDDCSRITKTIDLIQQFSSRNGWKVVRNEESRGHSAACAAGGRLASRPYLCLLNSDTVVTPWCWRAIQEAFETDLAIGVAGPCTSFSGGNEQTLDIARKCRFYWNDNQICAFAERLNVAPPQPVIFDLPWVGGFAFFIRRSLWKELGGFDENLADYANEVELCIKVAKLGYRIVWVRSGYVHHFGGQSYGKKMSAREIKSRNLAGLRYIHNKDNCQSPTEIARPQDGQACAVRSAQDVANL